nr:hypothetical protein [Gemmatimonadales bacterium]
SDSTDSTEPEQLRVVKASVLSVLSDLCERPVTDLELSRAKCYLLGSYALSHQRMKEQAYALAWYEMLGLGADFEQRYAASVQEVTAPEVQDTARKVFRRFVLAIAVPIR